MPPCVAYFSTSISWSIVGYTSLRFWTNINQYLLKFWPSFTASCTKGSLVLEKLYTYLKLQPQDWHVHAPCKIIQNVLKVGHLQWFFYSLEWRLPLETENTRGISHYSLFLFCGVNFKWSQSVSHVTSINDDITLKKNSDLDRNY